MATRLDRALVDRGLVSSRTKAQELIHAGQVRLNGDTHLKPATPVTDSDTIDLLSESLDVGRGAGKLRYALAHWDIDVTGRTAVDLGASTGGFTQVLLDLGARRVIAVDVGHGQLDPRLVGDARVVNLEGVNILQLTPQEWSELALPQSVELVVGDLSFVSLTQVIPVIAELFGSGTPLVLLVKPQFEVGRGKTREGIVVDDRSRQEALQRVVDSLHRHGWEHTAVVESPMRGKKGNIEYLVYASAPQSAK